MHLGIPKHNCTCINWNYTQLCFINKINIDSKFDSALFGYLYLYLIVDPSHWMLVGMVMNLQSYYTKFVAMRFTYDLVSNKTSIVIFLTCIFIWKTLVISFSSYCWRLLKFTPFCTDVQAIFSSMSELLSTWLLEFVAIKFFFLAHFFQFFSLSNTSTLYDH